MLGGTPRRFRRNAGELGTSHASMASTSTSWMSAASVVTHAVNMAFALDRGQMQVIPLTDYAEGPVNGAGVALAVLFWLKPKPLLVEQGYSFRKHKV